MTSSKSVNGLHLNSKACPLSNLLQRAFFFYLYGSINLVHMVTNISYRIMGKWLNNNFSITCKIKNLICCLWNQRTHYR